MSSFLKRAAVVAASVVAVLAADVVRADYTCYVATNGVDAEGRGGSDAPFRTLEYAVTAAKTAIDGGETAATVNVAAGTYDASAELTLDKAIGIVGADAETTIVNGAALSAARAVTMTHADAYIEKLTFQDCKTKVSGGAVSISAGTLAGCRFVTCQTKGNNTWGGALNMSSGFVTNCLFYGCSNPLADNYGKGAAVYLSGGTIIGCRFEANSTSWVLAYDGGLYVAGGTVANCVFTKHTKTPLYNNGGTVANCLFYGNTCSSARGSTYVSHYLAGVYQAKGTLVNCTIACNTNTASAVGCAGLVAAGGTVKNTIVYDCPSADGTASSYSFTGVTASNNLLDAAPSFVDVSAGNFHVKAGSLAIDTGADVSSITTADLDGVARPQLTAYDIGCYEYVSTATKLTASIVIRTPSVGPSDAATFAAFVEGPNLEGLSYARYLDGEAYASGSDKSEISITGASVGSHTLKLVVTNSAGESSTSEVPNAFCVRPLTTYVSETGGNIYPYETSANAARSLDDALAALWISSTTTGTVNIAAGTYALTKSYTLTTAVRLVGADAETTILDGSALSGNRAVTLSHAGARLENLTFSNCQTTVSGGAVSMSAGTIDTCRFVTCQTKGVETMGGALYLSGGLVTNCLIRGCSNPLENGYGYGAAAYVKGGTLVGCRFEANSTSWVLAYDGCLYVAGGAVANCVFTGHTGLERVRHDCHSKLPQVRQAKLGRTNSGRSYIVKKSTYD